jgi:hypothetical protein
MKEVRFNYNPLADTLEQQANIHGFTLGDEKEYLEDLRLALTAVDFGDLITASEADIAYRKLHRKVLNALKPINEEGIRN